MEQSRVGKAFKRVLKAAGLPRHFSPHSLRHTFASLLLQHGEIPAYVDLDEGFRIMTNIVGIQDPTTDIQCGMRVKVRWEDQGDGEVSLPMFEPA